MAEINWLEVMIAIGMTALVTEMTDWLPRFSEWMIRHAAQRLPKRADVREAEWLAILDRTPGKISKLLFAVSCALIVRAAVFNVVLNGAQRFMIWLSRLFLIGLAEVLARHVFDGTIDAGIWLATAIGLILLLPAAGRRNFDPSWFPAWTVPAWAWKVVLAFVGLVIVNGLWVGDRGFVLIFVSLIAVAYGRDLHDAFGRPRLIRAEEKDQISRLREM